MLESTSTPRAQATAIITAECERGGVTRLALQSNIQACAYVEMRKRIAVRLHNELGYTPVQIAPLIGRERSTVLYYLLPETKAKKNAASRARYHGLKAVAEALA